MPVMLPLGILFPIGGIIALLALAFKSGGKGIISNTCTKEQQDTILALSRTSDSKQILQAVQLAENCGMVETAKTLRAKAKIVAMPEVLEPYPADNLPPIVVSTSRPLNPNESTALLNRGLAESPQKAQSTINALQQGGRPDLANQLALKKQDELLKPYPEGYRVPAGFVPSRREGMERPSVTPRHENPLAERQGIPFAPNAIPFRESVTREKPTKEHGGARQWMNNQDKLISDYDAGLLLERGMIECNAGNKKAYNTVDELKKKGYTELADRLWNECVVSLKEKPKSEKARDLVAKGKVVTPTHLKEDEHKEVKKEDFKSKEAKQLSDKDAIRIYDEGMRLPYKKALVNVGTLKKAGRKDLADPLYNAKVAEKATGREASKIAKTNEIYDSEGFIKPSDPKLANIYRTLQVEGIEKDMLPYLADVLLGKYSIAELHKKYDSILKSKPLASARIAQYISNKEGVKAATPSAYAQSQAGKKAESIVAEANELKTASGHLKAARKLEELGFPNTAEVHKDKAKEKAKQQGNTILDKRKADELFHQALSSDVDVMFSTASLLEKAGFTDRANTLFDKVDKLSKSPKEMRKHGLAKLTVKPEKVKDLKAKGKEVTPTHEKEDKGDTGTIHSVKELKRVEPTHPKEVKKDESKESDEESKLLKAGLKSKTYQEAKSYIDKLENKKFHIAASHVYEYAEKLKLNEEASKVRTEREKENLDKRKHDKEVAKADKEKQDKIEAARKKAGIQETKEAKEAKEKKEAKDKEAKAAKEKKSLVQENEDILKAVDEREDAEWKKSLKKKGKEKVSGYHDAMGRFVFAGNADDTEEEAPKDLEGHNIEAGNEATELNEYLAANQSPGRQAANDGYQNFRENIENVVDLNSLNEEGLNTGNYQEPQSENAIEIFSPFEEVSDDTWAEFVSAMQIGEPNNTSQGLGMFGYGLKRLGDFGLVRNIKRDVNGAWNGDWIRPYNITSFLDDIMLQLDLFTNDIVTNADHIMESHGDVIGSEIDGQVVTLSGLLAVAKNTSKKSFDSWVSNPDDRMKFPRTTDAFNRANGIF